MGFGVDVVEYANTWDGWAMYVSPRASSTVYICPEPARARRPRPVTLLFDQWDNVSELFIVGVIASDFPVQATRALRCDNFQSEVPSS